jgi:hypothetical protein
VAGSAARLRRALQRAAFAPLTCNTEASAKSVTENPGPPALRSRVGVRPLLQRLLHPGVAAARDGVRNAALQSAERQPARLCARARWHAPTRAVARGAPARRPAPEGGRVSWRAQARPGLQAHLCDAHDEDVRHAAARLAGEGEAAELLRRGATRAQGASLSRNPAQHRERRKAQRRRAVTAAPVAAARRGRRACSSPRTPASSRLSRAAASATVSSVSQPPCAPRATPHQRPRARAAAARRATRARRGHGASWAVAKG